MQALQSEGMATGGGQIIVAEPCFMYVKDYFAAEMKQDAEGNKFYLVENRSKGNRVKITSESIKMRAKFSPQTLLPIQSRLEGFTAHSVVPYLRINQEGYCSENRSVTVMFVNLGVDLETANSQAGMQKIHRIMIEV